MRTITKYISTDVDIDIDLEDFSDEELLEEVENRGLDIPSSQTQFQQDDILELYNAMIMKLPQETIDLLWRNFFWEKIGRIY